MTAVFEQVGRWVVETSLGDIPAEALHAAKRAIIDVVGVTFAARGSAFETVLHDYRKGLAREGPASADVPAATIIGQGVRTDPEAAAFANGALGHALDFDDGNDAMQGHPSTVIFPAAFAAAEISGASGASLLEGYAIGFEVAAKVGRALGSDHRHRGWHPTGTVCVFGAAAAAAKILGLNAGQVATALSIAASMAAGINANTGSMTNPLHAGRAAENGLFAARMAASGMNANLAAFEHPMGFAATHQADSRVDVDQLRRHLGEPWDLVVTGVSLKPFPCCGMAHVAIDAALAIHQHIESLELSADAVESVDIWTHPVKLAPVDRPEVADVYDALFSVQYVVATALVHGSVGLEDFTPQAVLRPEVHAVMRRTQAHPMPDDRHHGRFPGEVSITLANGEVISRRVEGPRGNATGHPLTDEEVEAKFRACLSTAAVAPATIDQLLATLRGIDEIEDLAHVTALLA